MCDRLRVHAHPKVLGAHFGGLVAVGHRHLGGVRLVVDHRGDLLLCLAGHIVPPQRGARQRTVLEECECAKPRRHKQHDHGEHDPRPDMMPFARRRGAAVALNPSIGSTEGNGVNAWVRSPRCGGQVHSAWCRRPGATAGFHRAKTLASLCCSDTDNASLIMQHGRERHSAHGHDTYKTCTCNVVYATLHGVCTLTVRCGGAPPCARARP